MTSNSDEVSRKLPQEAAPKIEQYFAQLGKDFVYGFDFFKDSTIKIYVRKTYAEKTRIDIEENLSYYPVGKNIHRRQFPAKDTILNQRWQYWTRFNEERLF